MNIANNIYNKLINNKNKIQDDKIIQISNLINNLLDDKTCIKLPQIITVGTQSSGKSSVLNSIMGIDLLPTNNKMCTRCPLNIELIKINNNNSFIEFGNYDINWNVIKKINLSLPYPTNSQLFEINEIINNQTIKNAGKGKNISSKPIYFKLYSPNVKNLSLIDLPGLIMLSQKEYNQPDDIKKQLENLILKYIKNDNSIILTVMQSRIDLETNHGLFLIKKNCIKQKIIGVLTKVDLMDNNSHIGAYLKNDISEGLKLNCGYFAIKNRNNHEIKYMSVQDGIDKEKEFFKNHQEYSKKIYYNKLGIDNLTSFLNKILINDINKKLPNIINKINELDIQNNNKIIELGYGIPEKDNDKYILINKYFHNFIKIMKNEINNVYGKNIKHIFIKFRNNISDIKPFINNKIYNESYFKTLSDSIEGNHMFHDNLSISILEYCMTDNINKPLQLLFEPSLNCLEQIINLIKKILNNLLNNDKFNIYNKLLNKIIELINEIILKLKDNIKLHINNLIDNELYVWTDDKDFRNIFNNGNIIEILESYYNTVKLNFMNNIPKIIMNLFIKKLIYEIENKIFNINDLNLLTENNDLITKRKLLFDKKNKIKVIKEYFN